MRKIELSQQEVDDLQVAIEQWIKNARDDLEDEYFATMTNRLNALADRLEAS